MRGAQPFFSRWWVCRIPIIIALAGLVFLQIQVSPAPVRASSSYSVSIIDYAFQPLHINVTTGTTVVWTYSTSGKTIHTVTSDPGTNKTQGGTPLLNSGSLMPGQSFNYVFDQPGFYPYQCSVHPTIISMNGWVNVTGTAVTPPPTPPNGPGFPVVLTAGIVALIAGLLVVSLVLIRRRWKRVA